MSKELEFILFADDTNVFLCHKNLNFLIQEVKFELIKLTSWFQANRLSINIKKTKYMLFKPRQKRQTLDHLCGESTPLPPMWPGFDSQTRRHMWVEFVVGSRPCSEGFSPGSPPSTKTNITKFQFDLERTDTFERVPRLRALCCFVGK